jgi:Protein of unknown function (DUF2961)
VRPCITVPKQSTATIMDVEGSGVVQQIWMTPTGNWRFSIIRVYWDGSEQASIECPAGDFFACGWGKFAPVVS